jgi:hypothetical protein
MYFPKITTDPHDTPDGSYLRITARRRNGDRCFVFREGKQQVKAIRKILMRLARHFNDEMIRLADFYGLDEVKTTNAELIACLSSVPDPYAGVDPREALIAAKRDLHICMQIMAQDPSLDHLMAVSNNFWDWTTYWRCCHPTAAGREREARELAEMEPLRTENRERYERIKLNGRAEEH